MRFEIFKNEVPLAIDRLFTKNTLFDLFLERIFQKANAKCTRYLEFEYASTRDAQTNPKLDTPVGVWVVLNS